MGLTFTDMLLFGSATTEDFDSVTFRIIRNQMLMWGAIAHAVEVVVSGIPPLSLVGAVADSLTSLKAFGGTGLDLNTNLSEYTQVEYVQNATNTLVKTGVVPGTLSSMKIDLLVTASLPSGDSGSTFYIFEAREAGGSIFGIGGPQSGKKISGNAIFGGGVGGVTSGITRTNGNQYHVVYTVADGTQTLDVENLTTSATDTQSLSYTTINSTTAELCLFGNTSADTNRIYQNNKVHYAKFWRDGVLVLDLIPVKRKSDNVVGFYNKVDGRFLTATEGSLTAGNEVVPTPSDPLDIYCNNGKLKFRKELTVDSTRIYAFINTDNRWTGANDSYTIRVPVTVGKKYRMYFTTTDNAVVGNIFRCGFTDSDQTPTILGATANIPLIETNFRSSPQSTSDITVTASGKYMVIQLGASFAADIINNQFKVAYEDVYTDGPIETIAITTRNLNNDATNVEGYYIAEDGTITAGESHCYSAIIPVISGQTYTWSGICAGSSFNYKRVHGYIDGVWNQQIDSARINGQDPFAITFTVPAGINGIRISHFKNDTDTQVEVGSTKTAYVAYNNCTATVNNLFAIGNCKDVQEIITGVTTHNVAVKVFNGTENWVKGSNSMYLDLGADIKTDIVDGSICSHYQYSTETAQNMPDGSFKIGSGANTDRLLVKLIPLPTDAATYKSWLAAQCTAGTPVIVVYPLATPFEEPAPIAQPMTVVDGDNTVSLTQQGMTPLTLEATYTAGVSVTITEIENANIGNDVDVVIA